METRVGVLVWTLLLLTSTSELDGEPTTAPSALTPTLTLSEVISIALHVTPKSNVMETQPDSTHVSMFPPNSESSHTAATAFSPPPEPNSSVSTVSGVSAVSSPAPGRSTETAAASSDPGLSSSSVRSSTITPGSMITNSTAASYSEEHQTSHQMTISGSETLSTASPGPSASTRTAWMNTTQPTGPVPPEDPHLDKASELDVGDEGSVPHASPWDPLLAALVSIFIVSTALVSVMLFLRFRQQSEHPEFHRLQDLPMDDLLEDTPLSRYSY